MVAGAGPRDEKPPLRVAQPPPDDRVSANFNAGGCLTLLVALALCLGILWAWPWLMATRDGWYAEWEVQKAKQKAVAP